LPTRQKDTPALGSSWKPCDFKAVLTFKISSVSSVIVQSAPPEDLTVQIMHFVFMLCSGDSIIKLHMKPEANIFDFLAAFIFQGCQFGMVALSPARLPLGYKLIDSQFGTPCGSLQRQNSHPHHFFYSYYSYYHYDYYCYWR
jgi:hypothetical protein